MRTALELDRTRTEIDQVAKELGEMLRQASDGNRRLPRSQWTVAQTAAHLAVAQQGMAEIATGAIANPYENATLRDFAPINESILGSFSERDLPTLAGLIVERTRSFIRTMGELPDTQSVPSPMGTMEARMLYVYNLAHLLMHGHPLARALGRRSPVNRERALLVIPFLQAVIPKVFNKQAGANAIASLEIRMRRGPRFFVTFDREGCRVESTPTRPVGCRISADPAAFFLVGAGVVGQWGPIARGEMIAWGTKPWLAFKLKSLLSNP